MDTIAEMLTTIKNAQMAGHGEAQVRSSKMKSAIVRILKQEGFVEDFIIRKNNNAEYLNIYLKYYPVSNTQKKPSITGAKKISKPGQRIYVKGKDIRKVRNSFGIGLISTSRGVMTSEKAKSAGLGGEYICEIW